MTAEAIEIRKLRPDEAGLFREIRLDALRRHPEAFGASFEIEDAKPLDWFADRLSRFDVFGAFREAQLVGMAGFAIHDGPKRAHKGLLWTMFVCPSARGAGIGRRLVEAVIAQAREKVEILDLTVIRDNQPARRLYAALGFVEYGLERRGLKLDGRYYDEVLMAKDLA